MKKHHRRAGDLQQVNDLRKWLSTDDVVNDVCELANDVRNTLLVRSIACTRCSRHVNPALLKHRFGRPPHMVEKSKVREVLEAIGSSPAQ
jgi:hypothetical protein